MSDLNTNYELSADHNVWLADLAQSKSELKSLWDRLQSVISSNTSMEVAALVEQFQNQFIREQEVIDILKHDIKAHENVVQAITASGSSAAAAPRVSDHAELRERVQTFHKIYSELRSNFDDFSARYSQ